MQGGTIETLKINHSMVSIYLYQICAKKRKKIQGSVIQVERYSFL